MATWHQLKRATKLWHDTKWTVVIDPPNSSMSCILCETAEEAQEALKKYDYAYILPPQR